MEPREFGFVPRDPESGKAPTPTVHLVESELVESEDDATWTGHALGQSQFDGRVRHHEEDR